DPGLPLHAPVPHGAHRDATAQLDQRVAAPAARTAKRCLIDPRRLRLAIPTAMAVRGSRHAVGVLRACGGSRDRRDGDTGHRCRDAMAAAWGSTLGCSRRNAQRRPGAPARRRVGRLEIPRRVRYIAVMAMKETEGSLRGYLLLVGAVAVLLALR